ncbi:MAG: hypothetical protein OXR73_16205 [Myxococcales bacterium]|nr:hypothetical protein [Myxococcales bacterium]
MRALVLALCAPSAAGCGDTLFFNLTENVEEDGAGQRVGGGCFEVSGTGGFSTATGGSRAGYTVEYHATEEDSVRVAASTEDGEVVRHRTYSESFLASGQKDELTVTLPGSRLLRLTHWGSFAECDPEHAIE